MDRDGGSRGHQYITRQISLSIALQVRTAIEEPATGIRSRYGAAQSHGCVYVVTACNRHGFMNLLHARTSSAVKMLKYKKIRFSEEPMRPILAWKFSCFTVPSLLRK